MSAAAPPRFLAPLAIEARAARGTHIGMGARRARRAGRAFAGEPIVVAGFCGALDPSLRTGDVVLADSLRGVSLPDQAGLAATLRRAGLTVHVGPIVSSPRFVTGARRRELARTGALAVDMESAYVAESVRPLAVLRVVFDTGRRPLRALAAGPQAYRTLRRACALAASHLEQ